MAKDANELISDDFIRRSIRLDRFTEGERRETLKSLKKLEKDLTDNLRKRERLTNFNAARTESLLKQTQASIAQAYGNISGKRVKALKELYSIEKEFAAQAVNSQIGAPVLSVITNPETVRNTVNGTIIEGAPIKEWWKSQSRALRSRFENAVRSGILAGESMDEISRRVRGTQANNFEDGIMAISRRNATAHVRTSVQAVANSARRDTFKENVNVIKSVQQLSTLDTKTTSICKSYSGLVWDIRNSEAGLTYTPSGHEKDFANVDKSGALHFGPPRHWQCRSTLVPITRSWEELSGKKIKPAKERKATFQKKFEKRLKERGFSEKEIKTIKARTRASMNGQVSRDLNFEQWLETQSESVQIEALGQKKWEMWKSGRIKNFRQLTDNSGRPLTIDDLKSETPDKRANIKGFVSIENTANANFQTLAKKGDKVFLRDKLQQLDISKSAKEQYINKINSIPNLKSKAFSAKEKDAIEFYQAGGFRDINGFLRGVEVSEQEGFLVSQIDQMDSAFKKVKPLGDNYVVYRGFKTKKGSGFFKAGNVVFEQNYTSTTLNPHVAKNFSIDIGAANDRNIIRMRLPRETRAIALDLGPTTGESEVLLPRGTSYKILDVTTETIDGDTYNIVDAEYIIPETD